MKIGFFENMLFLDLHTTTVHKLYVLGFTTVTNSVGAIKCQLQLK